MKLFAKKTPKYTFKEQKKEPEISSPIDYQIEQWFKLKKWIGANYDIVFKCAANQENTLILRFTKFFSVSERLHVDFQLTIQKEANEREHKIIAYVSRFSNDSLGRDFSLYCKTNNRERRDLLKIADPSNFEYWINYDSGLV